MDQHTTSRFRPFVFFLHLAGTAALFALVIALISLFSVAINHVLPDPSVSRYGAEDALRRSLTTVILVFPLLLWLRRLLARQLAERTSPAELALGRWISYGTMFLSGGAIVVALAFFIHAFLGGELTARFALKVLSVVVVAVLAFADHRFRLKEYRRQREISVLAAASVLVALSLAAGFLIIGSPDRQREIRFDEQRASDLQEISWGIESYYREHDTLPDSLLQLDGPLPEDPAAHGSYGYRKTGDLSYELCATFSRRSEAEGRPLARPADWTHPEGYHCFSRTVEAAIEMKR